MWTGGNKRATARKDTSSITMLVAWCVWKHGNVVIFDNTQLRIARLLDTIKAETRQWATAGARGLAELLPLGAVPTVYWWGVVIRGVAHLWVPGLLKHTRLWRNNSIFAATKCTTLVLKELLHRVVLHIALEAIIGQYGSRSLIQNS